ncbi:AraC family transcriptional regulator [Bifidobacterium hapali]|uniref:AraC family transcriptional regulator n=1 Tax=Bifidobacterium hapali TaxID=1630172 RepID=A0A261G4S9_9BIFI|nr:helix-turn-helix domain-containing protein [Bifidobacterium hapali]OZG66451.1 AraC family transcriptional regulator [Bifidobacterium hapali]
MSERAVKRPIVLSDLSERVPYNIPELPIYAFRDPLSSYADYRCACHWHRDLEFVHVISGAMQYFVNGVVHELHVGEGLVVNSSRLHYGFSPQRHECWFTCAVISPALIERLTSDIAARCDRAFDQHMDDCLRLSPDVLWQQEILKSIDQLVIQLHGERLDRVSQSSSAQVINPLPAVATAVSLLNAVLGRFQLSTAADADVSIEQHHRIDVLNMTGLIQQRFAEPLSVEDIAVAGNVSRTQCCLLFRQYVGHTPNEYLTERRIEEAKRLLSQTDGAIAQIARACGFASASYFISVFRARMGVTPGMYRERQRNNGL